MKDNRSNKLVSTICNIVSTVVLSVSILVCILVIVSMKSSSGVANLFGYTLLSVQSDSMEKTFFENDLIVVKCTKPSERFQVGDVVSFVSYDKAGTRFINTHRIVEVVKGETRDRYTTQGDNSPQPDMKKLYSINIVGKYTGKRIAGLGKIVDFINSPTGVLLCVVIPSAIIVIAQIISYSSSSKKRKEQMMQEAEERARMDRIQLVNDVMNAQRGYAPAGAYVTQPTIPADMQFDDAEKNRVIEEFLARQREEEAKKQAIIEEYLQKQKEAEAAAKEEADAAKIKAIIAEFLAQQKAGETTETPEDKQG